MKSKLTIVFFFLLSSFAFGQAGNDRLAEIQKAIVKDGEGWVRGAGIGLDFAQLAMINPRFGSGENRLGFGGLGNVFANYKKDRIYWLNRASLQLSIQKIGVSSNPLQKNLDRLVLGSKVGRKFNDKWAAAVDVEIESQLTPTYEGNILKPVNGEALIAKFFSPATIRLSPGIDYFASPHLTFFFSPAALKMIYIADQGIADRGTFGTQANDNGIGFKKSDVQFGATLKGIYNNKYFGDKLAVNSVLDLYSNYLRNPQNIDVNWHNDLSWNIWKGLALNLVVDVLYDDDIFVQVDRNSNKIYEPGEQGKRATIIQALLIKYNLVF